MRSAFIDNDQNRELTIAFLNLNLIVQRISGMSETKFKCCSFSHFNTKDLLPFISHYWHTEQITTINGAAIIRADIKTDNGVIHILDSIISPAASGLTIAHYIEKPEDPSFSFRFGSSCNGSDVFGCMER